ncbi:amidohydrolase [Paenibacillus hamazuiensis]|uniref:amidohydrolase n=1 Tax=Paenibacillus hamazuiensis TaxID=2936508 RepID=UPI00200DF020|nr:amidohydrolase [Paenibacillus hamazuiensis]
MTASSLLAEAEALLPELTRLRRDFHRHPELSMQEFRTTAAIKRLLEEAGIRLMPIGLPVGAVAEIAGAEPGPTVALRADIDALPIQEETGLPFASEVQGVMHACGHDFHMTALLGAARLLHARRERLRGSVRLLFQPAEEKGTGALALIEAGALDGVQAIFGLHNKPELPVGKVGIAAGPLMASVDGFRLTVTGRGGHAAIPEAAIDPIVAASAIVGGLQTAVSRSISPFDSAVVSVCRFQAGTAWNVIPDEASLDGTVRAFRPEVRSLMPELLQRIAAGIASGYGAEAALKWYSGIPSVTNDGLMADLCRRTALALDLEVTEAKRSAGGEDFAYYQTKVPGCFMWVGTGGTEEWHHPRFTLDERALAPAAALLAGAAIQALEHFAGRS